MLSDLDFISSCCIASIAPAWKAEFPNVSEGSFICALKKLGFWGVSQTVLGVPLVVADVVTGIKNTNNLYIITACPAAAKYINSKFPEFSENLVKNSSPLYAHVKFLKSLYGTETSIVFIGPCSSKLDEARKCNDIATAVSFNELRELFLQKKINPSKIKADNSGFIPFKYIPNKNSDSIIDGGVSETLKNYSLQIHTVTVSGIPEIEQTLSSLKNNVSSIQPMVLTVLACKGGCLHSPEICVKNNLHSL